MGGTHVKIDILKLWAGQVSGRPGKLTVCQADTSKQRTNTNPSNLQTPRNTYRQTDQPAHTSIGIQADRQTDRLTNRLTEHQTKEEDTLHDLMSI